MIPPMPHDLPEPQLKPNTEVVLQKRYLHKKADGSTETPRDLFWRVASAIAAEEAKYERSPFTADDLARQFYDLMTSWRFLPNSPTLMNAASELGQLSACFVLPVGDSIEEIFDAVKFAAMIHKSGGGTGFSFSRLRPKASRVGSTGGVASGPVSFLRIFNTAMQGKCDKMQALADTPLSLSATVHMLPCRGDAELSREIFEPLGYTVEYQTYCLDEKFPEWGDSAYLDLTLTGTVKLSDL